MTYMGPGFGVYKGLVVILRRGVRVLWGEIKNLLVLKSFAMIS